MILFLSLVLMFGVTGISQARADPYGQVGSIDNATSVKIRRDGKTRTARTGDPISPGDTVVTDARTTMTIRCSEGSVIVVGRSSKVAAEVSENAQRTARIDSGTLRAIVSKIDFAKHEKKKNFRFFIKTRSATIGVRGTDFVVSADTKTGTEHLHTLEGTVEIAKNEKTLVTTGGEKVTGGEAVTATPKKITAPVHFDQKAFSRTMSKSQPDLAIAEVQPAAPTPSPSPSPTASPKPAPKPVEKPEVDLEPSRSSLHSFEVESKNLSEFGNTHLHGVEVGWAPMLELVRHWLALRGTAGAFWLPSGGIFTQSFEGFDFRVVGSLRLLGHVIVEGGPSMQVWFVGANQGTQILTGPELTLGWEFTRHQFGALDRIFFSTSNYGNPQFVWNLYNQQNQNVNCGMGPCNTNPGNSKLSEVRIGVGFRF